jgi:predicted Kef-type K+ transport protein
MPHDISLIATITMGLVLAFFGGLVAHRLRLPPLVGYLLAGVALGPFTPGRWRQGRPHNETAPCNGDGEVPMPIRA